MDDPVSEAVKRKRIEVKRAMKCSYGIAETTTYRETFPLVAAEARPVIEAPVVLPTVREPPEITFDHVNCTTERRTISNARS